MKIEIKSSWLESISLHSLVLLGILFVVLKKDSTESVDFDVIENPAPNPNLKNNFVKPLEVKPKIQNREDLKKGVFGISRKSNLSTNPDEAASTVKLGNTLAKKADDKKLLDSDPDQLPIPTDEYLVSEMPRLIKEIRIPYPPEAKRNGIEGAVVFDLLIDSLGRVREAVLVKSPGYGLSEAAQNALFQFQFSPARIGDKPVAVKIRYSYRFVIQ